MTLTHISLIVNSVVWMVFAAVAAIHGDFDEALLALILVQVVLIAHRDD